MTEIKTEQLIFSTCMDVYRYGFLYNIYIYNIIDFMCHVLVSHHRELKNWSRQKAVCWNIFASMTFNHPESIMWGQNIIKYKIFFMGSNIRMRTFKRLFTHDFQTEKE